MRRCFVSAFAKSEILQIPSVVFQFILEPTHTHLQYARHKQAVLTRLLLTADPINSALGMSVSTKIDQSNSMNMQATHSWTQFSRIRDPNLNIDE